MGPSLHFTVSLIIHTACIWYIRKILVHVPRAQLRWWRTHHLLNHLFVTFCKELKTERKRWRKICLCRQSVAQCTPPGSHPLRTRERKVRRGRIEGRKDEMREEGWKREQGRRKRIFSRLPGYVTSPRQNNFRSYGRQVVFARWSFHIDSCCSSRY